MRISPQAKDVPELAEYLLDVPKAIDDELKKAVLCCWKERRFWDIPLLWYVSLCYSKTHRRPRLQLIMAWDRPESMMLLWSSKRIPLVSGGPFITEMSFENQTRWVSRNSDCNPPEAAYWGWTEIWPVLRDG